MVEILSCDNNTEDWVVKNIIEPLPESSLVIDLGGGIQPLRRANWVVDIVPYHKRHAGRFYGEVSETFNEQTWICSDLCDDEWVSLLPKEKFDFAFCNHTLEDLRDPIGVIRKISKIARRGFIGTPHWSLEVGNLSRIFNYGNNSACCGYPHHRWLMNASESGIECVWKPNCLGASEYRVDRRNMNLLWDGEIAAREIVYPGHFTRENFMEWLQEIWR